MMNQGPNILKIQRSKKGQKKAQGTQPHLKDTSMFQSKKKMAKKGRKKVKKAQKKSPEEAKAEVVEILVTIFFFIFLLAPLCGDLIVKLFRVNQSHPIHPSIHPAYSSECSKLLLTVQY